MSMQIAWTRLLSLLLGSSVYAFSIILTTFLLGLALGSLVFSRLAGRVRNAVFWLGSCQAMVGLLALGGVFAYNVLFYIFLTLFNAYSLKESVGHLFLAEFLLAGIVIFLPTFFMGACFPLGVRAWVPGLSKLGKRIGEIYSVNTVGAIAGSFLGGFVLLPGVGLQKTVELAIILYLVTAFGLLLSVRPTRPKLRLAGLALTLGAVPVVLFASPEADPHILSSGVYKYADYYKDARSYGEFRRLTSERVRRIVYYREGITTNVTVIHYPKQFSISVNGKVDGSSVGDMPTQVLTGHIPMLFAEAPEKIMVIGYGTGVTLGSLALWEGVSIDCVELEGAVVEAGRFFRHVNQDTEALVESGKVRIVRNDGRNLLMASPTRYDVVVSEPSNPWISGSSKLFTREFFRLVHARLNPGSVFGQWVQLYGMDPGNVRSLIRTFRDVFGRVVIFQPSPCADLLLVGRREGPLEVPRERLEAVFRNAALRADLARVGVDGPASFASHFLADDDQARRFVEGEGELPPLNTDDNSFIEFSAPKTIHISGRGRSIQEILEKGYRGPTTVFRGYEGAEKAVFLARAGLKMMELRRPLARELLDLSFDVEPTADGYALRAELWKGISVNATRTALDKGLDLDPEHRTCLLRRAQIALEDEEIHASFRFLRTALMRFPDDMEIRFRLGLVARRFGRQLGGVIESLAEPAGLPLLASPRWNFVLLEASITARALEHLQAVRDSDKPLREFDRLLFHLGEARLDAGDASRAREALENQLLWAPADLEARERLAEACRKSGRIAEAKRARGPDNHPDEAKAYWKVARGLFGFGALGEGVEKTFRALDRGPLERDLLYDAGFTLDTLGFREEAAEAWRRGVRYFPGDRAMVSRFAFLVSVLAEGAAGAEDSARLLREAASALRGLAEREKDPLYRNEFRSRARTCEEEASNKY